MRHRSKQTKRQVLPHNRSWEENVTLTTCHVKVRTHKVFPLARRRGAQMCGPSMRDAVLRNFQGQTPLNISSTPPPTHPELQTQKEICGPKWQHTMKKKANIECLFSPPFIVGGSPPLFWGLSKHTFTTNNHARVRNTGIPGLLSAERPLIAKINK